nr:hypothetical protein [Pantoea sp. 201603H]
MNKSDVDAVLSGKARPRDIFTGESLASYFSRKYLEKANIAYQLNSEVDARTAQAASADETIRQLQQRVDGVLDENVKIKLCNDVLSEELRGYESDGAYPEPVAHKLWHSAEHPEADRLLAERDREMMARGVELMLNVSPEYLDTDCVMDRHGISYEDAKLRSAGATEFHDAIVFEAKSLRNGEAE